MKQNKSRKQTLESAQYGLEISFNKGVVILNVVVIWHYISFSISTIFDSQTRHLLSSVNVKVAN